MDLTIQGSRNTKYYIVNVGSPRFKDIILSDKEAMQCLHHAYVFGVDHVVLLVGNTIKLEFGIIIKYPMALKEAYGRILSKIYEESLAPFYTTTADQADQLPQELICMALQSCGVDWPTFKQHFQLWRATFLENRFVLPIPPSRRVLPIQASVWNIAKGGSDTITHLIWNAKYNVPHKCAQSSAIAHFLMFPPILYHKHLQILTAKEDLSFYPSLNHMRNAANKRSGSMKTTHDRMSKIILELGSGTWA